MRYIFILLILAAGIFVFGFSGCHSTSTSTVPGNIDFYVYVTDENGNPLSGAKVVSENQPAGQLKITGLTDNAGNVIFNNIRAGDYTLYINRFDYNQVQVAITITPTNNGLTVRMTPTSTTVISPSTTPVSVTFNQLLDEPGSYNGRFLVVEGYYFSGFEIAVLTSALTSASYNPENVTPVPPLIWITGNLGQNVYDNLHEQTGTPSGYPEYFGRVKITGQFQYGSQYGHMNAYNYQLTAISAEYLE